jgi:hypothetical protein
MERFRDTEKILIDIQFSKVDMAVDDLIAQFIPPFL